MVLVNKRRKGRRNDPIDKEGVALASREARQSYTLPFPGPAQAPVWVEAGEEASHLGVDLTPSYPLSEAPSLVSGEWCLDLHGWSHRQQIC